MSIEETRTEEADTIAERVAAGARWLDEYEPGWVDRIDLESLDLGSCDRCIAGQLLGDFVNVDEQWPISTFRETDALGFSLPLQRDLEYDDLTAAWRTLITARRALTS